MKRCLLALLAALVLGGCTIHALKLGYRQADTLVAWRANEYFDFDSAQKQDVNARLARILYWHRYEQLPEYAAFLTAFHDRIQPGLRHEDIVWLVDGAKARYRTIVDRGAAEAAQVLATLTPEQLGALQKQWAKDNRKFSKEHELAGTAEDRRRVRLKQTLKQIEDWSGSLSSEQEQKMAEMLDPIPNLSALRYADRLRRQKEFLELLKLRGNKQDFPPKLQAWLRDWEHGRNPEYARLADDVYERRIRFYLAVEKLLTPEQRKRVMGRIQDFVGDFYALSQRPTTVAR